MAEEKHSGTERYRPVDQSSDANGKVELSRYEGTSNAESIGTGMSTANRDPSWPQQSAYAPGG